MSASSARSKTARRSSSATPPLRKRSSSATPPLSKKRVRLPAFPESKLPNQSQSPPIQPHQIPENPVRAGTKVNKRHVHKMLLTLQQRFTRASTTDLEVSAQLQLHSALQPSEHELFPFAVAFDDVRGETNMTITTKLFKNHDFLSHAPRFRTKDNAKVVRVAFNTGLFTVPDTPFNRRLLCSWVVATEEVNRLYKDAVITREVPPLNKNRGILNWDIPLVKPALWLRQLAPQALIPSQMNPIIEKGKQPNQVMVRFGREWFNCINMSDLILTIQQRQPKQWDAVFPLVVMNSKRLLEFLRSDAIVASVGWDDHARIMYKDKAHIKGVLRNTLVFLDPWKRSADLPESYAKVLQKERFVKGFMDRPPEQASYEDSCGVISLARIFMIGKLGIPKGVRMSMGDPVAHNFLLLANQIQGGL